MLLLFGASFAVQVLGTGGPHGFPVHLTLARWLTFIFLFCLEYEEEGRSSWAPKNQACQCRRTEPAAPSSGEQDVYTHPSLWRAVVCGGLSGSASSFWFR